MPEVALSTMWGLGRFSTLSEFFHEASRAGFTRFELNHGVSPALLNAVSLKGCTIASIHEPCPADPSAGELKRRNWLISARDEERRQEGVRAIERSIDLAQKLGPRWLSSTRGALKLIPRPRTRCSDCAGPDRPGRMITSG